MSAPEEKGKATTSEHINLRVIAQDGTEVLFKIKNKT
eukprot:CAMPEP_0168534072 /NCGR_PEP_ID=MMETSP0405-20121227/17598_1 /TAXON_ID=498012 /ORGANISM="Trichosphaerium sp, Strain Am-I-7 wt" /LENGTH=36 /DNA_ID= /DNA_START= /DNA_END= /DNA_ORIENTATION=